MKYKVGDKVRIKSLDWYNENKNRYGDINYGCETEILFTSEMSSFCGQVATITRVRYIGGVRFYHLAEDKEVHLWVNLMFEGLVEEESLTPPLKHPEDSALAMLFHKTLILPEGYQFVDENGNVIEAKKIVLEKKKKEYPKTYEECLNVLAFVRPEFTIEVLDEHYERLISSLYKLLICRDAYWKLAGDWNPDSTEMVYSIGRIGGTLIGKSLQHNGNTTILEFPTPKMRDAFYENFKDLIEECKELL